MSGTGPRNTCAALLCSSNLPGDNDGDAFLRVFVSQW